MEFSEALPLIKSSNTKSVRKPNFFIVGAPKCGTTSMHFYLKQHPDIYMSTPKEPFYFGSDLDSHKLKTRDKSEYLSFFNDVDSESMIGESTVWYLYSSQAASEIKNFNPNSKIVIMLRNPVDAIHALHSQFVFSGNEPLENFRKALDAESRRKNEKHISDSTYFKEGLFYRDVYKYSDQIKRFFREFGRNNVKVITLRELKRSPKQCYDELLEFLGVSEFTPESFDPRNSNCQLKSDLLKNLVREMPGDTLSTLRDFVPVRQCAELWQVIKPILVDEFSRSNMDPSIRKKLTKEFKTEAFELGELLNQDFTHWTRHANVA